jgi:CRP/FNR family cyclic AMP-dependent transcriptional regulator
MLGSSGTSPARTKGYVRLLEVEPDLGADLRGEELVQAQRLAVAPAVDLPSGPVDRAALADLPTRRGRAIALLVADGLLIRDVVLARRVATQLLGPGDLLDAGEAPGELLPAGQRLTAAEGTRVAVIDDRFLAATRRWPWMAARLLERTGRQVERGAIQQAISQLGRVELRLLALMWHLAERFGRMTPNGVVVSLDLTHEALGRLAGAARPTVTLALKDLAAEGQLVRRDDGSWLLARNSCDLLGEVEIPSAPASVGTVVRSAPEPAFETPVDMSAMRVRIERLRAANESCMTRSNELMVLSDSTRGRSRHLRAELERRRDENVA